MIFARAIARDSASDLALAYARMGLPTAAREYLAEKIPHLQLLLTGLTRVEGRFLRHLHDEQLSPGREDYPMWIAGDQEKRPGSGLLGGRRDQFDRLLERAKEQPELAGLRDALRRALDGQVPAPLVLGDRTLAFGSRTYVMGVVNVTPDSFSDGGRFFDPAAAIQHGLALAAAGADLLDIGGESTRPGSRKVSADEELERILPVIEGLRAQTPVPISVDTTKAAVAKEALARGVAMVNDISGFQFDPELAKVTAAANAACSLMHIQGTPETMQKDPRYGDVVEEIAAFLAEAIGRAEAAGIPRSRVIVDPGIGFGKTFGHNLFLLRRLQDFRSLGCGVLVGTSRKAFLGHLTGGKAAGERLAATLGSISATAVLGGADIVRVHDVAEARDAVTIADAIHRASEGGEQFLAAPRKG